MYRVLKLIVVILLTSHCLDINAQSLYTPVNIVRAYDNQTRSVDGKPGLNYWTNNARYFINVELDPLLNKIYGEEKIIYFNNSPDSLNKIVLRNYMDFFKRGSVRNIAIAPEAVTEGVDIQQVIVSGQVLKADSEFLIRTGTNLILNLNNLLTPGSNIELELKWSCDIPQSSKIRTGVYDSSSYFISLWYPQVAVYDDIDGWDMFNYTGLQEFYNSYSDYEVNITVPKEFVVWATGSQTNAEETFTEKYLSRIDEAIENRKLVNLITEADRAAGDITLNKKNVWKFSAKSVPDFAFAASDKYLWDIKASDAKDKSGEKILISSVFDKNSKDFYEVAEIAEEAIKLMATHLPGVPFPYNRITVFNSDGDSGMEFPMIINDGSFTNRSRTTGITTHEILHQYFPFQVGTNERKYAWMDEGWARMMQFDIQETIEPSLNKKASIVKKYSGIGGSEFDVPLLVPSMLFDSYLPYKTHAYTRPSMALLALIEYRGLELFKEALREYINRWEGKHPIPYDFFYTFNDVYGEDLKWFWNPWFFEFGYPDLGIKEISEKNGETIMIIENKGGFPLPVEIKVIYESGAEKLLSKDTGVWKNGNSQIEINLGNDSKIKEIHLGSIEIPDVNQNNNQFVFGQNK